VRDLSQCLATHNESIPVQRITYPPRLSRSPEIDAACWSAFQALAKQARPCTSRVTLPDTVELPLTED
jgi:hypothetical protein